MKPTVGRLLDVARFSLPPRGGEDVLRQGLIMLACYAAYDISRAVVVGREAVAMANGLFFINFENGFLANPFAAMPSLHFAYALFLALALFMLARQTWLRWGGFAYPALVLLVIVATGNHFFVDAVGSVLVLLAAYVLAASVQTSDVTGTRAVTVRERDG